MVCTNTVWMLALWMTGASHAFVARPLSNHATLRVAQSRALLPVFSTTSVDHHHHHHHQTTSSTTTMDDNSSWENKLQSEEIQKVRLELIRKYIGAGKTVDIAEQEVDDFLRDPQRSQSFLAMRHSAILKAYDDMGLGVLVQTSIILFLCLFATVGLQYYNAYKVTVTKTSKSGFSPLHDYSHARVTNTLCLSLCSVRLHFPMALALSFGCNGIQTK